MYLNTGECLHVYMCKSALVIQHRLVFICALEGSWESLRAAVAKRTSARAVDLWFEWVRVVSDISLKRRMQRKGVQRGREGPRLCLSRCVICSRLSKHLQSAGSPGMQRQG